MVRGFLLLGAPTAVPSAVVADGLAASGGLPLAVDVGAAVAPSGEAPADASAG